MLQPDPEWLAGYRKIKWMLRVLLVLLIAFMVTTKTWVILPGVVSLIGSMFISKAIVSVALVRSDDAS